MKLETSGPLVKWPSIKGFHHIRKNMERIKENYPDFVPPVVFYYSKIKLHGTNAGIQVLKNGEVKAQSRSRILSLEDDNCGFASWVSNNQEYFKDLSNVQDIDITIFGEWCGKGIQKSVAISEIDRKIFAVFAVQFGENNLLVDPYYINKLLPKHPDVFVLPWNNSPAIIIDWGNDDNVKEKVETINKEVEKVEEKDVWVSETFKKDGTGEGLVYYPVYILNTPSYYSLDFAEKLGQMLDMNKFSDLIFKAKGDKHKIVKQKKPAQLEPEIAKSVSDFVNMFLTTNRLEQAVFEGCGGEYDSKKIGNFIKWIGQDIKKESSVELEASGLKWKQVSKSIIDTARKWYMKKIEEL